MRQKRMLIFITLWAGQLASTLGSSLTGFALGVWIYQQTGSTTLFAISLLLVALPHVVVAPLAGALVDRWDRRLILIMVDVGAGLGTLAIALLFWSGHLQIWHIYAATAVSATLNTFQWPAYGAATSLLVPKEHLGRAGGMVQIGEAISQLIAPAVAGTLFVTAGLGAVLLIDLATLVVAICTLLFVSIPRPNKTESPQVGRSSLLSDVFFGWRYIVARPGLLGLLIYFAVGNFMGSIPYPLLTPMILDLSSPDVLGYVNSIAGAGMVIGTLVMSAWGGTRRRVLTILLFDGLAGLFFIMAGLRPSIPLIAVAGFGALFAMPFSNGASQALWQSKVAPDVQGRVFAARSMIAYSAMPLAYLLAGPLADYVFNPLLTPGGLLADGIIGQVIGVGPGRGIGLMFVVIGLLFLLVVCVAAAHPRIRRLDLELPDAILETVDAPTQRDRLTSSAVTTPTS